MIAEYNVNNANSKIYNFNSAVLDPSNGKWVEATNLPSNSLPYYKDRPIETHPLAVVNNFFQNKLQLGGVQSVTFLARSSVAVVGATMTCEIQREIGLKKIDSVISHVSGGLDILSLVLSVNSWIGFKKLNTLKKIGLIFGTIMNIVGAILFLAKLGLYSLAKLAAAIGRIPVINFIIKSIAMPILGAVMTVIGGINQLKEIKEIKQERQDSLQKQKLLITKSELFAKVITNLHAVIENGSASKETSLSSLKAELLTHNELRLLVDSEEFSKLTIANGIEVLTSAVSTCNHEMMKEDLVIKDQTTRRNKAIFALAITIFQIVVSILALLALFSATISAPLAVPLVIMGAVSAGLMFGKYIYNSLQPEKLVALPIDQKLILAQPVPKLADPQVNISPSLVRALVN